MTIRLTVIIKTYHFISFMQNCICYFSQEVKSISRQKHWKSSVWTSNKYRLYVRMDINCKADELILYPV